MTQRDAKLLWGWTLWAIAAVWPTIAGALAWAMASPYERALAQSWCGVSQHDALSFLGHCAPCWAGAAALALAGGLIVAGRAAGQFHSVARGGGVSGA